MTSFNKPAVRVSIKTMATSTKSVAVSRIYLDPQNPRHDPIANEPDIVARLLKDEDIRPLAKHIARTGELNPLELVAIVPHPTATSRFVVAEGNRRICALKLLLDPDKAPTEKDKKYFRALQKTMARQIKSVDAVIFDSMPDTRPWVGLRHDGEPGVATKTWSSSQSTRFNLLGEGNSPNAQALRLLDFARRKQLLSEDDLDAIGLTTVTRYLSNPVVRSAIGLSDTKTSTITVPENEFSRALTKFLQDALGAAPKVHSRSKATDRAAYGESLHAAGFAPTTRGLSPYTPEAGPDKAPAPHLDHEKDPVRKAQAKKAQRDRDNDRTIVPPGFEAPLADPVFQRLFRELSTLPAETFSFAATYLLRAVIEQAAFLFVRRFGGTIPPELHLKLSRVADILQSQGYAGKGLPALRKMSSDVDSRYSPDSIGLFIHGGAVPTKINTIRLWDTFEPILTEMIRQFTAPKKPQLAIS